MRVRCAALWGAGSAAGVALLALWTAAGCGGTNTSTSAPSPLVVAAPAACPTAAANRRADAALAAARYLYQVEQGGRVIHADLRRIAQDQVLLHALMTNNLRRAAAEARAQLSNHHHVVRIRVVSGSRVLVDANATSFDLAGSATELRDSHGRSLGQLQITIQDVIGFIKIVVRWHGASAVVVRGQRGQVRSPLPAAIGARLPASGCANVGGTTYVIRSFNEAGFTGEPLAIWLLVRP